MIKAGRGFSRGEPYARDRLEKPSATRRSKKPYSVIGVLCAAILLGVASWYFTSSRDRYGTLLEDVDATRNVMLDVFQVAYIRAREARATDVIVASDLVVEDFEDLKRLPLTTIPEGADPVVYNFRLMFIGKEPRPGDPQDSELNFFIKPMIAWPAWSATASRGKLPVLLVHPDDGYKMGAKAARIRWMSDHEVQELIAVPQREIDRNAWPYYRTEDVKQRLAGLR